MSFPGGSVVKNLPANEGEAGDVDSIPGSGRSPGEGNVKPLYHSCLENPKHRGACGILSGGSKASNTTEWLSRHACGNSAPWPGAEPSHSSEILEAYQSPRELTLPCFKILLSTLNWHGIICPCLKCTIWQVLRSLYIYEMITVKNLSMSIIPIISLRLFVILTSTVPPYETLSTNILQLLTITIC